jgi:hypothetical protein
MLLLFHLNDIERKRKKKFIVADEMKGRKTGEKKKSWNEN